MAPTLSLNLHLNLEHTSATFHLSPSHLRSHIRNRPERRSRSDRRSQPWGPLFIPRLHLPPAVLIRSITDIYGIYGVGKIEKEPYPMKRTRIDGNELRRAIPASCSESCICRHHSRRNELSLGPAHSSHPGYILHHLPFRVSDFRFIYAI
ncbi:hypothetical protein BJY04DRAFT_113951 [Aspergillus karnatakaensis]|uniref:uncharacterized protein n=1 Tax=Aspergillus karnatakaensis TaxID=1810916 RepID=UPI003CCD2D60